MHSSRCWKAYPEVAALGWIYLGAGIIDIQRWSLMEEKRRVGIISLFHENINYGGVLQAYALRKVIADMGYVCEQIRYDRTPQNIPYESLSKKILHLAKTHLATAIQNRKILQFIKKGFQHVFSTAVSIIFGKLYRNKRKAERRKNFKEFSRKYVPSSKIYNEKTIAQAANEYDIFVTGSDQVWNPSWYSAASFLPFAPDNKPKIAYAASVGVDNLTEEQYAFMQPMIQRLDYISVREENAVSLLQDMTDKKIEWVLDPTLLLSAEEWNEVAAENPVKEPYVFAYILGDRKDNQKCAEDFAKKKGLKLVTFPFTASGSIRQAFFGDIHSYGGPDVWLSLIRDAEYVITDSFHAVVFSIVYRKQFVVLRRSEDWEKGSMNSRMYSLCTMFPEIGGRIVGVDGIHVVEDEMQWDGVASALEKEKGRCLSWLWGACSLEQEDK